MRIPFTLRLIFHTLRSVWVAIVLALGFWIFIAPSTAEERRDLGLGPGQKIERPEGLTEMRTARAALGLAPEWTTRRVAEASDGMWSSEFVKLVFEDLARQDDPVPNTAPDVTPDTASDTAPDRGNTVKINRP